MTTDTSNMNAESEESTEAKPQADTAGAEDFQAKFTEANNKYLYLYSEFENFRRRTERDRLDHLKFGHESFLRELLQVVDNFERASEHAKNLAGGEKGSPLAQVAQGVEMVHYQMMDALRSQGVAVVNTKGAKFDPAFHEAVGEEDSDAEPGTIVKEMQKGYTLHGRLLRAARVVTARKRSN
ncbi:MAG: nucleotide exchange factor GrpE [Proteobacteria bacterium]|nr:MAG: nucleotide exchange factor GrpE [Pseudomonadota bacterium]